MSRQMISAAALALAMALTVQSTPTTMTSPTGGTLPATVTQVGGVVTDLKGANGVRVVSQLAASQLYDGYSDSGTPAAYMGNPLTIGIQSGFTPAILSALGGGLQSFAVRITLYDGDTGPGNFDDNENQLLINGATAGNFSDIVTEQTSSDGLTQIDTNPSGGFRNETLDTGFFVVTDPAKLATIFTIMTSLGQITFQLQDDDPTDNYFDFTQGVDGSLIDVGQGPSTVGPTPEEAPEAAPVAKAAAPVVAPVEKKKPVKLTLLDAAAIASAAESGLPFAIAHREVLLGFSRAAARDLNARLFRARSRTEAARDAEATELNEAQVADRMQVFAAGDYSSSDSDPIGDMPGIDSETLSGSAGVEYFVDENFNAGFGATFFDGSADLDNDLADIDTTGVALAPYVTYVRGPLYADLLYSLGLFQTDIERPTGTGHTAKGEPDSTVHTVELNAGWNVPVKDFVVGPLAGIEYRHGIIDSFEEDNGGSASLWYDEQTWDSMISRVGAQASYLMTVKGVKIVPQLRAGWEHEYLDDSEEVRLGLVESPITIIEGNKVTKGADFSATLDTVPLQEDYLAAGAGVWVGFAKRWSVVLDYEGHYFRGDSNAHYASLRVGLDL